MHLKKRQDRLATQGETTSKGKLVFSNRAEHNTVLIAVEMSVVLAKPIHPEDHVKVVHLYDSKIGGKATAQDLNVGFLLGSLWVFFYRISK